MSDRILDEFLAKHKELGRVMLSEASSMFLIATEDGRIHWANPSFLQFIGYSMWEFTKADGNVTWRHISLKDDSLEADEKAVADSAAGGSNEYWVGKSYIPKGKPPVPIKLHIRRYPKEGQHEFFVGEVTVLESSESGELLRKMNKSIDKMAEAHKGDSTETISNLEKIAALVEAGNQLGLGAFVRRMELLVEARPKLIGSVVLGIIAIIGGKDAIIKFLEAYVP